MGLETFKVSSASSTYFNPRIAIASFRSIFCLKPPFTHCSAAGRPIRKAPLRTRYRTPSALAIAAPPSSQGEAIMNRWRNLGVQAADESDEGKRAFYSRQQGSELLRKGLCSARPPWVPSLAVGSSPSNTITSALYINLMMSGGGTFTQLSRGVKSLPHHTSTQIFPYKDHERNEGHHRGMRRCGTYSGHAAQAQRPFSSLQIV
jgi:hypothetical protein